VWIATAAHRPQEKKKGYLSWFRMVVGFAHESKISHKNYSGRKIIASALVQNMVLVV
jgi:hypothetical protein